MDYRRDFTPGASYFFTVVTGDRRPILLDEISRLRRAFRKTIDQKPFLIEAIVVLPDHLHTIWKLPADDEDYPRRWQMLKHAFSSGLPTAAGSRSQAAKREKGIWQRRFWEHRIRDERDWINHVHYIHYNPVRHGYVMAPAQWPHSSFHRFVARGILPANWGESEQIIPEIQAGE